MSTTAPATTAAPSGATTTETYDAAGNTLTRTDPNGTTNSFGELTSATNGAGQTIGYGYNAGGAVDAITYPLPASATWATTDTVNLTLDKAGLLTQVSDFNGNQVSVGYTADSQPNSAGLGSSGDTTFDNTDMSSASTLKNSGGTLQSFTYSDSPAGTILSETDRSEGNFLDSQSAIDYTRTMSLSDVLRYLEWLAFLAAALRGAYSLYAMRKKPLEHSVRRGHLARAVGSLGVCGFMIALIANDHKYVLAIWAASAVVFLEGYSAASD